MKNKELLEYIGWWNITKRDVDFEIIQKELDWLINGVCYSLKIFPNRVNYYQDIHQTCYERALLIISDEEKMKSIRDIKNFLFISFRNTVLTEINLYRKQEKIKQKLTTHLKYENESSRSYCKCR